MNSAREIFKSKSFRLGLLSILLFQLLLLLLTTPLYDLDTNSYIRGGMTWDVYHNPFLNILIAGLSKIWKNAWFFASAQLLLYSFAATFLVHVLFDKRKFMLLGLIFAAIEPITMFYNFSLISESCYTSFTLLYVAFFILWHRKPYFDRAVLVGLFMGLAFLCKLSALVQAPLLLLLFLKRDLAIVARLRHFALALFSFAACYLFVFIGQKKINEGEIYAVAGRVKWDFSSSQYMPDEIKADEFKKFVHPYIFNGGSIEQDRERRRELSFLGYKDCQEFFVGNGVSPSRALCNCDSLFGDVGSQILKKHFMAAEWKFICDNVSSIHTLNYLDYRFTEGLPWYYPEKEYRYLDSLMSFHYGLDLSTRENKIPIIWRSLSFSNIYIPILWWGGWIGMIVGFLMVTKNIRRKDLLIMGLTIFIPWVFHLVYISYRPRFLAPYFLLVGLMLMVEVIGLMQRRTEDHGDR